MINVKFERTDSRELFSRRQVADALYWLLTQWNAALIVTFTIIVSCSRSSLV